MALECTSNDFGLTVPSAGWWEHYDWLTTRNQPFCSFNMWPQPLKLTLTLSRLSKKQIIPTPVQPPLYPIQTHATNGEDASRNVRHVCERQV